MSEAIKSTKLPMSADVAKRLRIFGCDALDASVLLAPSPEQIHQLAVMAETVCTDPAAYDGRRAVNIDPTGYQSTCLPASDGRSLAVYWNPENSPHVSGMPIVANIVIGGIRSVTAVEKSPRLLRRPRKYQGLDWLYITADNEARVLRTLWGENEVGSTPKNRATKRATASEVELATNKILDGVRCLDRKVNQKYNGLSK